jgi:hypothetical protein
MRVIVDMLEQNTILQTIRLSERRYDRHIFLQGTPRLATNLYSSRVLFAIKKVDIQLRRALQTKSVRNKSTILWMLLSGNPDIVACSNQDGEPLEVAATRKRKHQSKENILQ